MLKAGDEVVKEKSRNKVPLMRFMQNVQKREIPDWLELNAGEFKGKVRLYRNELTRYVPIEKLGCGICTTNKGSFRDGRTN
ncbi:MAG: hypothetical protein R3B54_05890 [Bdellovibrionota bacterium]